MYVKLFISKRISKKKCNKKINYVYNKINKILI